ncbi:MAG: hypothetical protein RI945_144 [Candidatus Parcubacteria bacterium]|jgi:hypothetical protein
MQKDETIHYDNIPETWDDSDLKEFVFHEKPKKKWGFVSKLFLASSILLIVALLFASFSFFNNYSSFSDKNIEISMSGPASITSGEESSIDIIVANSNGVPLLDAYMIISYDSGENIAGDKSLISQKIDLGQVLPSMSMNKTLPIVLFGSEGSTKSIKVSLFYKISSSKAEFNKSGQDTAILIKTSPVSLSVNSLKEVRKNSFGSFTITLKNNTSNEMGNLIVSVRPPNEFFYSSSSLPLFNNNPSWVIKSLPANSSKDITFSGKFTGDVGSVQKFNFFAGVSAGEKSSSSSLPINNEDNFNLSLDNIYARVEKVVNITGQYLDASIDSDSSDTNGYLTSGELLSLEINYQNNLDYPLDNVVLSAKMFGDFIDKENTQAVYGIYDKESNTMIWNKSTMTSLAQVPAKASGKLRLQIRLKRDIPENQILRMEFSGKGERNSEANVSNEQEISINKTWVIKNN